MGRSEQDGKAAPRDPGAGHFLWRDSVEFARMVNLSDALFAIAMTLLVLRIEPPSELGSGADVLAQWPQVLAFLISFAVIAHFWWIHHTLVGWLDGVDRGFVTLTLALLCAVALVPWPTSLIGLDPTARAAVLPYLAVVAVIGVLNLLLLLRALATARWRTPLPAGAGRWLVTEWGASLLVTFLALGVAVLVPVAGLALLLATWPVEGLVRRAAPAVARAWL